MDHRDEKVVLVVVSHEAGISNSEEIDLIVARPHRAQGSILITLNAG